MLKNIFLRRDRASARRESSMPCTAEHKARTRERIEQSARSMFNRRGFASVSIEDIMSHAGLTRGGFYNHFASKTDLFI